MKMIMKEKLFNEKHNNGELRITHVNEEVRLVVGCENVTWFNGIYRFKRRYGRVQLVFDETFHDQVHDVRSNMLYHLRKSC